MTTSKGSADFYDNIAGVRCAVVASPPTGVPTMFLFSRSAPRKCAVCVAAHAAASSTSESTESVCDMLKIVKNTLFDPRWIAKDTF